MSTNVANYYPDFITLTGLVIILTIVFTGPLLLSNLTKNIKLFGGLLTSAFFGLLLVGFGLTLGALTSKGVLFYREPLHVSGFAFEQLNETCFPDTDICGQTLSGSVLICDYTTYPISSGLCKLKPGMQCEDDSQCSSLASSCRGTAHDPTLRCMSSGDSDLGTIGNAPNVKSCLPGLRLIYGPNRQGLICTPPTCKVDSDCIIGECKNGNCVDAQYGDTCATISLNSYLTGKCVITRGNTWGGWCSDNICQPYDEITGNLGSYCLASRCTEEGTTCHNGICSELATSFLERCDGTILCPVGMECINGGFCGLGQTDISQLYISNSNSDPLFTAKGANLSSTFWFDIPTKEGKVFNVRRVQGFFESQLEQITYGRSAGDSLYPNDITPTVDVSAKYSLSITATLNILQIIDIWFRQLPIYISRTIHVRSGGVSACNEITQQLDGSVIESPLLYLNDKGETTAFDTSYVQITNIRGFDNTHPVENPIVLHGSDTNYGGVQWGSEYSFIPQSLSGVGINFNCGGWYLTQYYPNVCKIGNNTYYTTFIIGNMMQSPRDTVPSANSLASWYTSQIGPYDNGASAMNPGGLQGFMSGMSIDDIIAYNNPIKPSPMMELVYLSTGGNNGILKSEKMYTDKTFGFGVTTALPETILCLAMDKDAPNFLGTNNVSDITNLNVGPFVGVIPKNTNYKNTFYNNHELFSSSSNGTCRHTVSYVLVDEGDRMITLAVSGILADNRDFLNLYVSQYTTTGTGSPVLDYRISNSGLNAISWYAIPNTGGFKINRWTNTDYNSQLDKNLVAYSLDLQYLPSIPIIAYDQIKPDTVTYLNKDKFKSYKTFPTTLSIGPTIGVCPKTPSMLNQAIVKNKYFYTVTTTYGYHEPSNISNNSFSSCRMYLIANQRLCYTGLSDVQLENLSPEFVTNDVFNFDLRTSTLSLLVMVKLKSDGKMTVLRTFPTDPTTPTKNWSHKHTPDPASTYQISMPLYKLLKRSAKRTTVSDGSTIDTTFTDHYRYHYEVLMTTTQGILVLTKSDTNTIYNLTLIQLTRADVTPDPSNPNDFTLDIETNEIDYGTVILPERIIQVIGDNQQQGDSKFLYVRYEKLPSSSPREFETLLYFVSVNHTLRHVTFKNTEINFPFVHAVVSHLDEPTIPMIINVIDGIYPIWSGPPTTNVVDD